MKVATRLYDCRCGGYLVLGIGPTSPGQRELELEATRVFQGLHDGDACAWGYQPVDVEVPDRTLAAAQYGRASA